MSELPLHPDKHQTYSEMILSLQESLLREYALDQGDHDRARELNKDRPYSMIGHQRLLRDELAALGGLAALGISDEPYEYLEEEFSRTDIVETHTPVTTKVRKLFGGKAYYSTALHALSHPSSSDAQVIQLSPIRAQRQALKGRSSNL